MSQPKKMKRAGPGGAGRSGFAKQKWTDEEEAALRAGVTKYGVGKWRLIQMDEAYGPVLANRSNVDLKDKWRNLNMDTSGARGDKRKKGRGRAPPAGAAVAAAAEGGAAAAAVLALPRRKRKRRPERAPGAVSGSPPRPRPPRSSSGGALRALQEAALGPDPDGDEEFSPRMAAPRGASTRPRRRTRRPARVSEDELDEEDEEERARYEAAEDEEEEEEEEDEPDDLEMDEDDESGMDDGNGAVGYNGGSGGARRGPTPDDMVVAAIISLQSPIGSHMDDILHWIENHYGGGAAFRRAVKLTLRRMVAAGRLESVAGRPGLFRLGGVVRHLTEGDSFGWPGASAADPGPTLGDARTVVEAALAAARATAEAEEAAACATRLSEAADHYEREAEAEQRDAPDQGPPGD